jgi:hypothetical protein
MTAPRAVLPEAIRSLPLGDKLERLANLDPEKVRAIEVQVDDVLEQCWRENFYAGTRGGRMLKSCKACPSPQRDRPARSVDSVPEHATGSRMLTGLVVLLRAIGLICRGHRAVALENLALRQQLAALTRIRKRSQLRPTDRLFWILLVNTWGGSGAPP